MKKLDPTVIKETLYVLGYSLIFSGIMQIAFIVTDHWNYTVILGNILGVVAAVGNFLLMGITIQNAVEKEEKDARSLMKVSQSMRMVMLFVVALIAYLVPVFNVLAAVIPYLFPRVAVMIRSFTLNNKGA